MRNDAPEAMLFCNELTLTKLSVAILVSVTVGLLTPLRCVAETRVALVIGNANYAHGGQLANPTHDAETISVALRETGFSVVTKTDLGREDFFNALQSFSRDLRTQTLR